MSAPGTKRVTLGAPSSGRFALSRPPFFFFLQARSDTGQQEGRLEIKGAVHHVVGKALCQPLSSFLFVFDELGHAIECQEARMPAQMTAPSGMLTKMGGGTDNGPPTKKMRDVCGCPTCHVTKKKLGTGQHHIEGMNHGPRARGQGFILL